MSSPITGDVANSDCLPVGEMLTMVVPVPSALVLLLKFE
jgi:hypothetical protein